ncbi:DNA polymerase III [Niastella koreensis]|uniref:DNA polymerase beta n=2 Tax=Niastella koreensis TaxID=354356 RepID=G8TJA3_NIAKG|nr:DNA polymerase/3'-5' exonuclease PolX [Niastella koreensis]AEV98636.1 PHP domain protein [Niastella koreensis GR20-10]OQP52923.1 DNA polymerase III [Niastella koreensis]
MELITVSKKTEKHNPELAAIFHQMASCYRYLGAKHRFRVMAYDSANRTINNLKNDISEYAGKNDGLHELKGIGESIGEKIIEYLHTGKINTFDQLKKKVPLGLLELMDINGLGPATVKTLHRRLHINNKEELIAAIEAGKLENLKGFASKKVENIKRGLKLFKQAHSRMLLWDAQRTGEDILQQVLQLPGIKKAALAGSLRRKKETIGDIDIVATADKKDWKKIVTRFASLPQTDRVLAKGDTRAAIVLKGSGTQVDLRLVQAHEYGAALLYFTGSKEHNIALRALARAQGYKLNEYGVFDAVTDRKLPGTTEEEIYRLFDLQFIPPELREAGREIETARKKHIPGLLQLKDMKGDLHLHSTWSDGADEIETIARYICKEFPAYEYIVITDHSPSERVAHGLQPADFTDLFREIERINKKLGKNLVKKGAEVDILANGSLDLPNELLQHLDWVVASIHSGFKKDNTERLLKACANKYVNCIGHPWGRLINRRDGYDVDWNKLFEILNKTGTAIEINAQPDRLDLPDYLVKEAVAAGVMIAIGTDAHALTQFDFMQLGVSVARRGWCEKANILNTHSWKRMEQFRKIKLQWGNSDKL